MKLSRPSRHPAAAFTMIEIAMSLAVIGFALVAIIGILPQGMDVQKENRRETIINQDANYLLQAIRGGSQGLDDLTNYVTTITNYWTYYQANGTTSSGIDSYTNATIQQLIWPIAGFSVNSLNPVVKDYRLTNGYRIVGLLSTPKYTPDPAKPGNFYSNYVVAYVRAISGEAVDKYPQNNSVVQEAAFGYRLVSEIVPWGATTNYTDPMSTNFAVLSFSAAPYSAPQFVANWSQAMATNGNGSITNFFYFTSPTNGIKVGFNNLSISDTKDFVDRANAWLTARNVQPNLSDVRLLFRWPLQPGGRIGNGRQTYRAVAGGAVLTTNDPYTTAALTKVPLYFVQPQISVSAK